jgi:hypothetical protein
VPRRAQRLADDCHAVATGQAGQHPLLLPMPKAWRPKPVRRRQLDDKSARARKTASEAKREQARTERNFLKNTFIFTISAPTQPGSVRQVAIVPPGNAKDRRQAKRQHARALRAAAEQ